MKRTCPICGGQIVQTKVRVAISGSPMGQFDGYRCEKCGEEFLAERSLDLAHDEIVRAGLFGVARQTRLTVPTVHGFWSMSDTRLSTTAILNEWDTVYARFRFFSSSTTGLGMDFDSTASNIMKTEAHSCFRFADAPKLETSQNGTVDKWLYQAPLQG